MTQGNDQKTDFGFKQVHTEEKASLVHAVFRRVAPRYDVMNDFMSLTLHRRWKRQFVAKIPLRPHMKILDVAAGTGDITRLLGKKLNQQYLPYHITATDINEAMLMEGKNISIDKGYIHHIDWQVANAEALPYPDNSFDAYTIAFGLRNVTDKEKALAEALRVLKPGGQFSCLEFSKVESSVVEKFYDFYSFQIITKLGKYVAGDADAYQYLVESIRQFPSQEDLKKTMKTIGFQSVTYDNLTLGIVAIHTGWKGNPTQ